MSKNELSQSNNWQDSLSEDLRSSESLGKFKDINSLAKSYLEAEQNLAKKYLYLKIQVLPKNGESFIKSLVYLKIKNI